MATSLLSSLSGIYYEESNLDFLLPSPLYFNCGVQILCVHGNGVISTGAQCFHLQEMSEIIFWDGSIMQLLHSSDDFQVRMVLYPKRCFCRLPFLWIQPFSITCENFLCTITDRRKMLRVGRKSICGWIWPKCFSLSRLVFSRNGWN